MTDTDKYEGHKMCFGEWLDEQDLPNNNWFIGSERPKDCYAFQDIVHEAYGNGSLAGIQGDYCCVVWLGKEERPASVMLAFDEDSKEYYLEIEEMIK